MSITYSTLASSNVSAISIGSILRGSVYSESPYRKKIEDIGFRFTEATCTPMANGIVAIRAVIQCACGKTEYLVLQLTQAYLENIQIPEALDPFYHIYHSDSFTPEHLEADGFPPDVVERAREIFYA